MKAISSRQHPIVRTFRTLAGTPDPAGERLLLDGTHLVRDAHAAGTTLELVVVSASRVSSDTEAGALAHALERENVDVFVANDRVFAALSPVRTPSGLIAVARRATSSATEICSPDAAFVLAVVDVQDPGNVGALLRVAEAGGVTGAFVCGSSASPFSWKALRGSMGSALRLPVVGSMPPDSLLTCMRTSGLRTIAAVPRGGADPDDIDWRGKIGVLLGGEGPGLTAEMSARCDARVTIPMAAPVESLNVAVAGAILIYAARRQRFPVPNPESRVPSPGSRVPSPESRIPSPEP